MCISRMAIIAGRRCALRGSERYPAYHRAGFLQGSNIAIANMDNDTYLEIVVTSQLWIYVLKIDGYDLSTDIVNSSGIPYKWSGITRVADDFVRPFALAPDSSVTHSLVDPFRRSSLI